MALLTRTYTFVDGTTAYGSQVESELANIVNTLNNLDTATTKWDQISILNATGVPLVADNSSGSQDVVDFKINGVTKVNVSSTGLLTALSGLNVSNGVTVATGLVTAAAGVTVSGTILTSTAGAAISGASLTMSGQTIAMGANKITGLANGSAATDAAAYGQLSVIQSVNTATTIATSTTGAVFTNCTNMSVTITPTSASNKVLIQIYGMLEFGATAANQGFNVTVTRAGTNIGDATNGIFLGNSQAAATIAYPFSWTFLDAPATTSATQYIVQIKSDGTRTTYWNRLSLAGAGTIRVSEVIA